MKVVSPWRREFLAGNTTFVIDGAQLSASRNDQRLFQQSAPAGQEWRWLARDDRYAYLTTAPAATNRDDGRYAERATIWRFDHIKGIEDAKFPAGPPKPKTGKRAIVVMSALPAGERLFVLTSEILDIPSDFDDGKMFEYSVSCFDRSVNTPHWEKSFKSAGERTRLGVGLWAPKRPSYASSDINHLSLFENKLVVCAGALEDILCLDPQNGDISWRTERIWEYQRGFIGPSVWQHFVHRVGADAIGSAEKKDAALVEDFNKHFECAIVGGPVTVALPEDEEKKRAQRLFIAVARGPADPFSGFISDGIVYELDERGTPVAVLNLPRMLYGDQFSCIDGAVVWACEKNAFVRIVPSKQADSIGMGNIGGPDCLGQIDWYRQLKEYSKSGWLVTDPAGDPVAFTSKYAIRMAGGGYVSTEDEHVFRFPLESVALATGADQALTLNVPFDGKLPPPVTNCQTDETRDGKKSFRTWGPYFLTISNLEAIGDLLRITLSDHDTSWALDFSQRDLQPR